MTLLNADDAMRRPQGKNSRAGKASNCLAATACRQLQAVQTSMDWWVHVKACDQAGAGVCDSPGADPMSDYLNLRKTAKTGTASRLLVASRAMP